jgi:hypothetical protein
MQLDQHLRGKADRGRTAARGDDLLETREGAAADEQDVGGVTCTNYCCGCLRPPCGGTEATLASMILSNACRTPSPDTSRVIEGFVGLAAEVLDLWSAR